MTELPPRLSPKALAQRNELIGIYRAAQARLQKQLTGAALSDFQQFRIGEQLKQIDAVVAALDASLADLAPSIIPAFYRHGTDLAGHALKVQGVAVGAINRGNQIHAGGVAAVADQMALDLYNSHQSIAATSKDILRKTQQSILEERQINRLIGQGLVEGQTPRDATQRLTKALKDRLSAGQLVKAGGKHFTPETYAELVVLTRTREAVTAGAINRGLEYGVKLFQISVHSTSCPQCLPFQGKVYSIVPDDRFPLLVERPPYHPRCLLPETPVLAPGKRSAIVATYVGPVVDLRLSNSALLSVTPNHMLLTPTGWAFAKDLREGDDVLCSSLFERVALGNPDNDNRPSTISDVVEALSCSGSVTPASVPVSPEDLHGDARFVHGNIDVIGANGLLLGQSESIPVEMVEHSGLDDADVRVFGLSGCRNLASELRGLAFAADGFMGRSRECQALFWGSLRHSDRHGLRSGPLLDLAQQGVDAQSKALADFRAMQTGSICTARITFQGLRQYSGHVYDLQTDSSLYIANGVISSNCRHVAMAYVEIPTDDGKAETDALSELSNAPGPISPSQAGFQTAVELAKRISGEKLTKQAAEALEATF